MESMFDWCSSLTSLDLSSFDLTNITSSISEMFYYTISLVEIKTPKKFGTQNTDLQRKPLADIDGNEYSVFGSDMPTNTWLKESYVKGVYAKLYTDGTLGFSNNINTVISGKTLDTDFGDVKNNSSSTKPWYSKRASITKVNIMDEIKPKDLNNFFAYLTNLTEIQNMSNLNISNATSMNRMFYNCSSLISLDLSSFDLTNVTSIINMFYNTNSLVELKTPKKFGTDTTNLHKVPLADENGNLYSVFDSTMPTNAWLKENYIKPVYAKLYTDGTFAFSSTNTTLQDKTVDVDYGNVIGVSIGKEKPWYSKSKSNSIKTVNFVDEVKFPDLSYYFFNCRNLTSIQNIYNLNMSYDKLDTQYMFWHCENLQNFDFSIWGTEIIGSEAFGHCKKIESVYIPSIVKNLKMNPFVDCGNLRNITVDSNNKVFNDGNGSNCVIRTSDDALVVGCNNTIIPNNVKTILYRAFEGCYTDTQPFVIPDNVLSIDNSAFRYCNFVSITLSNSLKTIGLAAFRGCNNLTSIYIPSSVEEIDLGIFMDCSSIANITVDENNTVYNDGNGSNCIIETSSNKLIEGASNTIIPNGVKIIGNKSFCGRKNLTSISIPSSITSIEEYSFSYSGLTTIEIPNNVTSIGSYAFTDCRSLVSIVLPNSIQVIEAGTFGECQSLNSIIIPSSVTSIGANAFINCNNLTSIIVNKAEGSISGAPWRATNATVTWNP